MKLNDINSCFDINLIINIYYFVIIKQNINFYLSALIF